MLSLWEPVAEPGCGPGSEAPPGGGWENSLPLGSAVRPGARGCGPPGSWEAGPSLGLPAPACQVLRGGREHASELGRLSPPWHPEQAGFRAGKGRPSGGGVWSRARAGPHLHHSTSPLMHCGGRAAPADSARQGGAVGTHDRHTTPACGILTAQSPRTNASHSERVFPQPRPLLCPPLAEPWDQQCCGVVATARRGCCWLWGLCLEGED